MKHQKLHAKITPEMAIIADAIVDGHRRFSSEGLQLLADALRDARLDEANWWVRNGQFDHRRSCSLDATNTPDGDYCDCDLAHRRKVASQRIAALERGEA